MQWLSADIFQQDSCNPRPRSSFSSKQHVQLRGRFSKQGPTSGKKRCRAGSYGQSGLLVALAFIHCCHLCHAAHISLIDKEVTQAIDSKVGSARVLKILRFPLFFVRCTPRSPGKTQCDRQMDKHGQ
ncbi:uncharacterized protein M421DRAFT_324055 [Didymella exigua CBS 183.55]|uniref:Uncharacterized protein n=1 Tax=Didymella exigua CBS 183.55 TaxID=1150837 RepID=A0A6A5RU12_9PLEO|nr:uncharacterized protein M421DRAFT_324055 [Didymella exigua CBS 183.55]KAF1931955.1 hypothetical protein M421DRAFT_324055 [Didymella exigua CBS 183.55]